MPTEKYNWKTRILLTIAPYFIYHGIKILFRTCRITVLGDAPVLNKKNPILFVSWHQGLLYYVYHFRNSNGIAMVSQSKDGELVARLLNLLGLRCTRGSSSRNGKPAMYQMIETIKHDQCSGGLLADAPRGPFGEAKMGIIKIAKETGLAITPVMCWAKRKFLLNNWDKTLVPLPFSNIVFTYGSPIAVPDNANRELMEDKRVELTNRLNQMHREAQQYFEEYKYTVKFSR